MTGRRMSEELPPKPSLDQLAYYDRRRLEANYLGLSVGDDGWSDAELTLIVHERCHAHLSMTTNVSLQYFAMWAFNVSVFLRDVLSEGPVAWEAYREHQRTYADDATMPEDLSEPDAWGSKGNLLRLEVWSQYVVCPPGLDDPPARTLKTAVLHDVSVGEIFTTPWFPAPHTHRVPIVHIRGIKEADGESLALGEHTLQELLAFILEVRMDQGDLVTVGDLAGASSGRLDDDSLELSVAAAVQFMATVNRGEFARAPVSRVELAILAALNLPSIDGTPLLHETQEEALQNLGLFPTPAADFIEAIRMLALHNQWTVPSFALSSRVVAQAMGYETFESLMTKSTDYVEQARQVLAKFPDSLEISTLGPLLDVAVADRQLLRDDPRTYIDDLPMRFVGGGPDVCLPAEVFDTGPAAAIGDHTLPVAAILVARLFEGLVSTGRIECLAAEYGECIVGEESFLTAGHSRREGPHRVHGFDATCSCPGLYGILGLGGEVWAQIT